MQNLKFRKYNNKIYVKVWLNIKYVLRIKHYCKINYTYRSHFYNSCKNNQESVEKHTYH